MDLMAALQLSAPWRIAILCILTVAITVFVIRYRTRFAILGEFLVFLKERKLWWMTPIIVVFLILSVLIIATEKSAILATMYAIF